jgi:serine/threonine-protein kinase
MSVDLAGTNDAAAAVPARGELVDGKYRVEGLLGEGGMGVVVAARHETLGHEVAIKVLHPHVATAGESVARFVREARTVATLRSEHVARVVDVGKLPSGAPFMVMERLVGEDLGAALEARGPLAVEDAVEDVLQATDALLEAHAAGIVHRDLKPSNLFILTRRPTGAPLVKILDFGISKVETAPDVAHAGKLTSTGAVMGSPVYMSPEQIRSAKNVDARSDIGSLGVILHELVTGRHPFEAQSLSGILAAISADPPIPMSAHRPDAPRALEALVLRCVEKDPQRRPQDVGAFAAELRHAALAPPDSQAVIVAPASRHAVAAMHAGADTIAGPTSLRGVEATTEPAAPAEAPPRSRRAVVALAAGAVLAVVAVGGLVAARSAPPGEARSPAASSTPAVIVDDRPAPSVAPAGPTVTPVASAAEPAAAEPAPSPSASAAAPRPAPNGADAPKPASSARRPATAATASPTPPPPAPGPAPPEPKEKPRDPFLDRK